MRSRHVILATRGYWALFHTWLAAPWDVGSLILGPVEKLQSHCALRYNKYTKQAVKSCRQSRALTHFPCCQPSKAPTCNIYSYTHPSMEFLCFMIPGKEWHDIGAASVISTHHNSLTHRLTSSKYKIKGMKHHSLKKNHAAHIEHFENEGIILGYTDTYIVHEFMIVNGFQ